MNKGKITAARRKHWVQFVEADPTQATVLASFPNEMAVPMTEVGHQAEMGSDRPETDTGWFY